MKSSTESKPNVQHGEKSSVRGLASNSATFSVASKKMHWNTDTAVRTVYYLLVNALKANPRVVQNMKAQKSSIQQVPDTQKEIVELSAIKSMLGSTRCTEQAVGLSLLVSALVSATDLDGDCKRAESCGATGGEAGDREGLDSSDGPRLREVFDATGLRVELYFVELYKLC